MITDLKHFRSDAVAKATSEILRDALKEVYSRAGLRPVWFMVNNQERSTQIMADNIWLLLSTWDNLGGAIWLENNEQEAASQYRACVDRIAAEIMGALQSNLKKFREAGWSEDKLRNYERGWRQGDGR